MQGDLFAPRDRATTPVAARLKGVDIFAGAGGVSIALRELGIDARHVEIDHYACETLRAAGFTDVVETDASNLASWLPEGRVDFVWASPPCPRWSAATRPQDREAQVDGWPWTLAGIDRMQPRFIGIENVAHAPVGQWREDLERRGYWVDAWLLNAENYGVPQRRNRWIVLARKGATTPLAMPEPTHGDAPLPAPLPMGGALDPIGDRVVYPVGQGRAGSEPWRLDKPSPTVMTTEVKGTRASATTGWSFNGGPDRASDAAFLALGLRRLNIAECGRLQGFPHDWPWQGTTEAIYRQIGNAVPPKMARAVVARLLGR